MTNETRPGYRGKCLYKTGKCTNERALKTSGQPHNLCDEHRNRQNEHQRKLDEKNRSTRKVRVGSTKDHGDTGNPMASTPTTGRRYAPYGKVRVSPTADEKDGTMLMSMAPQMMQYHTNDGLLSSTSTTTTTSSTSSEVLGSNGVVLLPNGPQPPQVSYPMAMQDFDGIVVPLPSYLQGHERIEFRSRIYQKVLDFIAEECILRFGAPPTKLQAESIRPPHSTLVPVGYGMSSTSVEENERRQEQFKEEEEGEQEEEEQEEEEQEYEESRDEEPEQGKDPPDQRISSRIR